MILLSFASTLFLSEAEGGGGGWHVDTMQYVSARTGLKRTALHLKWDGERIALNDLIVDSKTFSTKCSRYTLGNISEKLLDGICEDRWNPIQPARFQWRFLPLVRLWWNQGIVIQGTSRTSKTAADRNNLSIDGRFRIQDLNLKKVNYAESDTFFFNPNEYQPYQSSMMLNTKTQAMFSVTNRNGDDVQGTLSWRQLCDKKWSSWLPFSSKISMVFPFEWSATSFLRHFGKMDLWSVSRKQVQIAIFHTWRREGISIPRNASQSCLSDSLAGWYYEACGDFPASPILEYKSVAVKQQPGQKITPWGRMTWETRGKKAGWFLPRGQHFLPRVFRTDKAPKVDDFWVTPPKGVP